MLTDSVRSNASFDGATNRNVVNTTFEAAGNKPGLRRNPLAWQTRASHAHLVTLSEMQTVLVIDDTVATRTLTARYLTRGGYRVVTSGTVAGGLDLIKREPVALIVLDLHMPEFNRLGRVGVTEKGSCSAGDPGPRRVEHRSA